MHWLQKFRVYWFQRSLMRRPKKRRRGLWQRLKSGQSSWSWFWITSSCTLQLFPRWKMKPLLCPVTRKCFEQHCENEQWTWQRRCSPTWLWCGKSSGTMLGWCTSTHLGPSRNKETKWSTKRIGGCAAISLQKNAKKAKKSKAALRNRKIVGSRTSLGGWRRRFKVGWRKWRAPYIKWRNAGRGTARQRRWS